MAAAGLGEDLLLANEVLNEQRLGQLVASGARIAVAVDSPETVRAARASGVREVLIDVNVGLRRCGCRLEDAERLADLARAAALSVRGVMGYEGHAVGLEDCVQRERGCREAMEILQAAHAVGGGGEVVSWGETGTYACNIWANEIQAGSYALTDPAYGRLGLPFEQAVTILATVVSTSRDWSVADAGLKAFGMDHGKPEIDGTTVLSCSDEHAVFAPPRQVGQRVRIVPAHIDPTMAYHERAYVVSGETVIDVWPIDLRGW